MPPENSSRWEVESPRVPADVVEIEVAEGVVADGEVVADALDRSRHVHVSVLPLSPRASLRVSVGSFV